MRKSLENRFSRQNTFLHDISHNMKISLANTIKLEYFNSMKKYWQGDYNNIKPTCMHNINLFHLTVYAKNIIRIVALPQIMETNASSLFDSNTTLLVDLQRSWRNRLLIWSCGWACGTDSWNLFSRFFSQTLADIDLIFGIWVYHHELHVKFEFRSSSLNLLFCSKDLNNFFKITVYQTVCQLQILNYM